MKTIAPLITLILLGGCVYAESPDGRYASIDLPVHNQTTVHKTVTVNAPPGTIVNISETAPPTVIYNDHPRHAPVRCQYDPRTRQRVCYR